ncbi:MAG: cation:proton antiporter [Nanoarchaeota archaeon]
MVQLSFESQIIVVIGFCIILAYILNLFFDKKLKLPLIIAPLTIGLFLNYNLSGFLQFAPNLKEIIAVFANFGIAIMLFFIGLKVNFRYMKDLSKNAAIIAFNTGIIPFIFGLVATYLYTKNIVESVFVGVALAITAEEVSISILDELKLIKKRIGQLILDIGIIGDLFEIAIIAMLGIFIKYNSQTKYGFLNVFVELGIFFIIILLMRHVIIELLLNSIKKTKRNFEYFGVALITLLIMAVSSELLGFSMVIGALIAGMLIKDKLIKDKLYYEEYHIIESLEVFNFSLFHPLIFIWIGLIINLNILYNNLDFGLVLILIALSGKLIGSVLGNYFAKEPLSEGILIGWGLNARGATELFALLVAKNMGIISGRIFSAIILMSLITTIISPIIFKNLVMKGYGIFNH